MRSQDKSIAEIEKLMGVNKNIIYRNMVLDREIIPSEYIFSIMIRMLYLLSVITFSLCQVIPFIDSIETAFGGFGSTIIITESNVNPNDVDNTVFFGGLEANILNATENELIVSVPYGAYYTPISVYANELYASSSQRFNVIFDAAEELTVSHLSNQLDNPYWGKIYDIKIADMNRDDFA